MVWASSSWKLGYVNALTEKAWEDGQSCTHLYKRVEQIYCGFIITEVSNNGGDGLLRETSLKKSRCFKLYRAYSISSNSPNASNFFLTLNSNGLCQNSGKEKESGCLVCTSSKKREIRYFHVVVVQWRQRNVQKSVMHVQSCCVANLNQLFFFCLSRWCRRSIVIWTTDRSFLLNGTEHHDGKVWIRNRHCNFLKQLRLQRRG